MGISQQPLRRGIDIKYKIRVQAKPTPLSKYWSSRRWLTFQPLAFPLSLACVLHTCLVGAAMRSFAIAVTAAFSKSWITRRTLCRGYGPNHLRAFQHELKDALRWLSRDLPIWDYGSAVQATKLVVYHGERLQAWHLESHIHVIAKGFDTWRCLR